MNTQKCIIFKAKQNDVVIQLMAKDIFIDELWVKIDGETSWTIIGYNDLKNAIAKAEKTFNPKGLLICPQCQQKHNETAYNVFCCEACWNGY